MDGKGIKVIAKNSKAYHDYFIEDKYEAGIELAGTEVKSIRQGHVNLKDSFCIVKDGQMHVHGMHIIRYYGGSKLTLINKSPTPYDGQADLVLNQPIGQVLGAVEV